MGEPSAAAFIDLASAEGRAQLLSHLDRAKLSLSVELSPGTHALPLGRATLTVRRDTTLSLSLSLARDGDGQLALGLCSASLTRPVKLERALGGVSPFIGAIADLF